MGLLRDLAFLAFVLGGALLGSQIPTFVDAYGQRLGGALDEARATLDSFERAAAGAGLAFDDYRRRLAASEDVAFRKTGEAVDRLVERVAELTALQQAMAEAGPWTRPWVVVRSHDRAILERAYAQWRPGLTLDVRWGAAGLVLGWLLHAGGAGTARLIERARHPQWPRPRPRPRTR
jgi:hypothetical protein